MGEFRAKRETTYEAETPVGRVEIRVGQADETLERLLEFHSAETWAFLSAWNAGDSFGDEEANRRRQQELEEDLADREYRIFSGSSVPDSADWAPEESTLVVGIERDEALQIGREYGQSTLVWGRAEEPARLLECESGEDVTGAAEGAEDEAPTDDAEAELDEVLSELGGTVQDSVRQYRSEPPASMENAVDWELVLRSLDDDFPDPDLD